MERMGKRKGNGNDAETQRKSNGWRNAKGMGWMGKQGMEWMVKHRESNGWGNNGNGIEE